MPWGKIGICICYDLSYTRVTDELVRQGAQAIIVPTYDDLGWGRYEHELHARVTPMRAAEYRIPIFRIGAAGIPQSVDCHGGVVATAPFPGEEAIIGGDLPLPQRGRLPMDRIGAKACVVVSALFVGFLVMKNLPRRKSQAPPES